MVMSGVRWPVISASPSSARRESKGGALRGPLTAPPSPVAVLHWYHAYGRRLASELPLPELRVASAGDPFWTFRAGSEAERFPPPDEGLLGQQTIYSGCHARLYRKPDGWRIVVDDTGIFDLDDSGRTLTWHPFPGSTPDFGRAHLLGRVLATSMHFNGALMLHGSAVSFPAGAAVFLAPKHTGKSTLALALTLAGAGLISDDTIAVALPETASPEVWPGVHSLRLYGDSVTQLAGGVGAERRNDGKFLVADLPENRLEQRVRPLVAVYLLAAARSIASGAAVDRRIVHPPLAAAAMVGQGKISEMLGAGEAPVLLRRAARLASRVPVYQLAVHRDLDRLPEVCEQLAAWHNSAPILS